MGVSDRLQARGNENLFMATGFIVDHGGFCLVFGAILNALAS